MLPLSSEDQQESQFAEEPSCHWDEALCGQ
jgi:hypothetical protein